MTLRSIAEVEALLADNVTGQISPTDMRDVFETLRPGRGVIYIDGGGGAADTSPDQVTWKPIVTGNWTLKPFGERWVMTNSGKLKYTGAVARSCFVAGLAEIDNAAGQENGQMALAINGVVEDSTITNQTMGVAWHETVIVNAVLDLAPNDEIEILVRNISAGGHDINVDFAHLLALDYPA